jgi:large subunit ribosomal protein L29
MRTSELREMTIVELQKMLFDLRKEQFQLRMKRATGALEKFHQFRDARKLVARIKTILTEKDSEVKGG